MSSIGLYKDMRYLEQTKMLDYGEESIGKLVRDRGWRALPVYKRIGAVYSFVKDEILFGYNLDDDLPASCVLKDGYGQCNTKGTLFMALLRACDIPCRVHAFTIDKKLQHGAMTGFVYRNASLQNKFTSCSGAFCEYDERMQIAPASDQ